jgi:hypothetical protein
MTSDEHLTLDELAELDEGLLAPDRDPQVRRHLASCTQCQKLADDLTTASGLLRSLGPVPMPPEVAARIDQALAALGSPEAGSAESAAAPVIDPAPGADVVPNLADVRARRRWISAPTAAAATIVVLAVVAIVIGVTHKSHPNTVALPTNDLGSGLPASSGSAGSSLPIVKIEDTGQTYNAANLTTLVPALIKNSSSTVASGTNPQVPGALAVPSQTSPSKVTTPSGGGTSGGSGTSGGTNAGGGSSPATTKRHHAPKHHKLQRLGAAASSTTDSEPIPSALLPYQNSLAKVRQCATFNTPATGATLIAVDLGRWVPAQGAQAVPALILVYSNPQNPTSNIVFVVSPSCGGSDVLKYETIPATG